MPHSAASTTARGISVLLWDRQEIFRRGLASLLADYEELTVVGEADNAESALRVVESVEPSVVVADIDDGSAECVAIEQADPMAETPRAAPGFAAFARIKAVAPGCQILVLTHRDTGEDLYQAIANGASGYLLKDATLDELVSGVRTLARGQSLISPYMAGRLLGEMHRGAEPQPEPMPSLTARELQVLRLIARGCHNRDVAAELGIAENTAKNHVRNLLEKLGLHSRTEAVMYAVRHHLVDT